MAKLNSNKRKNSTLTSKKSLVGLSPALFILLISLTVRLECLKCMITNVCSLKWPSLIAKLYVNK